jgi:hypothetical protein
VSGVFYINIPYLQNVDNGAIGIGLAEEYGAQSLSKPISVLITLIPCANHSSGAREKVYALEDV